MTVLMWCTRPKTWWKFCVWEKALFLQNNSKVGSHSSRLSCIASITCFTFITCITRITCITCITCIRCITCITCVTCVTCITCITCITEYFRNGKLLTQFEIKRCWCIWKARNSHCNVNPPPFFYPGSFFLFKLILIKIKEKGIIQNHSWLCVVFSGVISYWLGQGCVYASSPVTTHIYSHTIIIIIFLLTIFHQHNHLRYHNIYHNHHHQLTKVLDTNL